MHVWALITGTDWLGEGEGVEPGNISDGKRNERSHPIKSFNSRL